MSLLNLVKKRKSTKRFSDKKPDWRKVIRAIDIARFIPAAGNIQTTKFILVQEKEKISQAASAAQQPFIKTAPMMIVVTSEREKVDKMYDYNKKGFSQQQVGCSIQNLLLALTDMKIDSCWVGFFEEEQMKKIFEIPGKQTIEAVIPIGYRTKAISENKEDKSKPELENIIYFDTFGNKEIEPARKIREGQEPVN